MLADASSQCRRTRDTRVLQLLSAVSPPLSLFAALGSQCVLRSQVGSCDDHHDHDRLPVIADAAHQDDCPGHLGQDDGLLSQR